MTVASENNRNQYNCNGSQVDFPYTFRILDEAHLTVVLADSAGSETELVLNTDYTVSGVGGAAGGNVSTVSTYASGYTLTIIRDVPITQETDYVENDPFPAQSHEDALDKLTMINQQQTEQIGRSLKYAVSDESAAADLPTKSARASKYLAFDVDGNPIASVGSPGDVPVTEFMKTVLDDPDATTALSTLGFSDFIKTLVDDADAGTARATLEAAGKKAVVVSKTADYTATADDEVILVDATSGAITISLPTAVGVTGKPYLVMKVDASANLVTIAPPGAETINGEADTILPYQYCYRELVSDGGNWIAYGELEEDIPIDAIKADRYFYTRKCPANTAGNYSGVQIYNPSGSGILLAVLSIEVWCSVADMPILIRSDTAVLPSGGGACNSLYWPSGGAAQSKALQYYQEAGASSPAGSIIWATKNSDFNWDIKRPWILGEGRGITITPDSSDAFNLCVSFLWAEV